MPSRLAGRPVFARNADPRVYWVMILEKAYAKYAGSYTRRFAFALVLKVSYKGMSLARRPLIESCYALTLT